MKYEKLELFVSKHRLDRYLVSCSNSKDKAKTLYKENLIVAQSFYPILNLLEIFLRNSINDKLSHFYKDEAWIINQKNGFMKDKSLFPSFWIQKQVLNAEKNSRGKISAGKIVSEQSFGFWTCLFEPRYYKLVNGYVIHCFPNKPSHVNRIYIANMLREIREFRNRIYHNEAICFNHISIDFSQALKIKNDIFLLLEWMDPELKEYASKFNTIEETITCSLTKINP
jgi:hypothetical protein